MLPVVDLFQDSAFFCGRCNTGGLNRDQERFGAAISRERSLVCPANRLGVERDLQLGF